MIIGIDGLRADALGPSSTPFLFQLAQSHGLAWDTVDVSNGRTQQTLSAPGWISVLTARWASAHGIVDNSSAGPVKVETLFERLQATAAESRSLLITPWKPLYALLQGRLQANSALQHASLLREDDAAVEQAVLDTWRTCQPQLAFIHLDAVDEAGHVGAFDLSDAGYATAVRETDARLRRMWENALTLPSADGSMPQRLVIVVSDHGGIGNAHGRYSQAERLAPLLAIAPSASPAVHISELVGVGQASLGFVRGDAASTRAGD
ncbi:Type I phosphodiesterase / nucleotide pyrophosphatase [compost metagenome]